MEGLAGKTAIITGGAMSLGAVIVRRFVDMGINVLIADVAEQAGQALQVELGDKAVFQKTDLCCDEDIQRAVDFAVNVFGRVDFLLNIAAIYSERDALEATRKDWIDSFNVNLIGHALLVNAALPHLKANGGGVVLNFGSGSGHVARSGSWLYAATKAAIHQATRSEALDLAEYGVRVNTVIPGWTWCRIMDELTGGDKDAMQDVAKDFHSSGRLGEPEEVANLCLFLCSDLASFINGSEMHVDGGYNSLGPEAKTNPLMQFMT